MGAARLLRGLVEVVDPRKLTVIVNTGDDEEFYGLHVSPDIDTILYTLAGMAPPGRGWGIRDDTFRATEALQRLDGEGWFRLGDRDLATHIVRSDALRRGSTLSECTRMISRRFGIDVPVLPVTDDRLRTIIHTARGPLAFQEYLVKRRAKPRVERVSYEGARRARAAPGVIAAIARADVVLIAPSNPFVSIGPILAVAGVRGAVRAARVRAVAVSPLIGGKAVKGPLASMLRSMGHDVGVSAIAKLYAGLAASLIVAHDDDPAVTNKSPTWPSRWPRPVAHDILIQRKSAATRLARFAVARALG